MMEQQLLFLSSNRYVSALREDNEETGQPAAFALLNDTHHTQEAIVKIMQAGQ